jgi:hypothetical protein
VHDSRDRASCGDVGVGQGLPPHPDEGLQHGQCPTGVDVAEDLDAELDAAGFPAAR